MLWDARPASGKLAHLLNQPPSLGDRRGQQLLDAANVVLAPSPAILHLTKTHLLCGADCDAIVRIRVNGRPYKHYKPAGQQKGVCPDGQVQVGQGLAANPNAPQLNVPVDSRH